MTTIRKRRPAIQSWGKPALVSFPIEQTSHNLQSLFTCPIVLKWKHRRERPAIWSVQRRRYFQRRI